MGGSEARPLWQSGFDEWIGARYHRRMRTLACLGVLCFYAATGLAADLFRIATYNVENYLLHSNETRSAKSMESRAKVQEHLLAMKADVVALQEVGGSAALADIRHGLSVGGLDYPHSEIAFGWDTNIQVAVLSRFPVITRRFYTNDSYLLNGRRIHVSRAFLEADIQVHPHYSFTLLTSHLKSRRQSVVADEAEMREQEAILLREKIDARLKAGPTVHLVVLGDLNDVRDSKSTRTVIGRRPALIDTRPAERNGDNLPNPIPRYDPRNI